MLIKKIAFLFCLSFVLLAWSQNNVAKSATLFDFVKNPNVKNWTTQEWIKGKINTPKISFDKEKGLHLTFPQENVNDHSYRAPNLNYKFNTPQDWSNHNFLAVDIYNPSGESDRMDIDLVTENGTKEVSHHKMFVPAQQQIQLKIPLRNYQNWKLSPANLKKVKQLNLIRRAPPRELNFYIKNIKLLKLNAPLRQYNFAEIQAWQFGDEKRTVKKGFSLITPKSKIWNNAPVTAIKNPTPQNSDVLWNSMITGKKPTKITFNVKNDDEYLVFALMQGRTAFCYDTIIKVENSKEYRHIIGNAYPEYRLFNVKSKNKQINVFLKSGDKNFQWTITALVIVPKKQAENLMGKFVWPAVDDMFIGPWDLRAFLQEKTTPNNDQIAAWDFYCKSYSNVKVLTSKTFSYLPKTNGNISITCPPGYKVKRALNYTRATYDGYIRQPRFFSTVKDEFSVRKGFREHFLLEIPKNDPKGKLKGKIIIKESDKEKLVINFSLDNNILPHKNLGINYFLYYYPFQFTGPAESIKAQKIQENAELAFMKEQGFSSLQVPMVAGIKKKDGKLYYNFSPIITFLKKYHKAGFDTSIPIPLYLYSQIHTINKHIGKQKYLYSGKNLELSIKAIQDFVKQADAAIKKNKFAPPVAWYPFDEFGNYPYVSKMHRAIQEVGGLTYSTSVGRYGNGYNISKQDGLTIYCYPRMSTNVNIAKLKNDIKKIGSHFWRYTIESNEPLLERYSWGIASYFMGVTGHGSWHFGPHRPSLSELQKGSYYYAYGIYGNNEVMSSIAMYAVNDAMQDYTALKILEKSNKGKELFDSLHKDANKLGASPTEQEVRNWFNNGGKEKLEKLRKVALTIQNK